jgi:Putative beta-barrel porin-2, OmpL-like. bbp2
MTLRKCVCSAAVAALALGSAAWAADQSSLSASAQPQAGLAVAQSNMALTPVYLDDATPTTLTPIMYELDKTSFGKTLESWNISIGGFVEGGYFYDTSNPRFGSPPSSGDGDSPTLIGFPGLYSDRGQLDQLDLMIQKTVDTTKKWDFGFQFEQGYGTDDAQIHSYGITDNRTAPSIYNKLNNGGLSHEGGVDPDNQYDVVQANVTFLVPLGSGLQIEVGKFVTLLGYETINPTGNAFFTHSYLFTFGIPLTQTGILGKYTFSKLVNGNDLTVTAGVTRGWNESSLDNNGEVDFLGEASANITDKLALTLNVSEGPESYEAFAGDKGDSHNYWSVFELIPTYKYSDQLSFAVDMLYADFPHGALTDPEPTTGLPSGDAAQWYAVAPYASYKLNSYFTLNARAEYYRDQGGFTVGAASGPVSANYYELTLGTQIHPFPTNDILQWLQIRPEVRYDLSDKPAYNASHNSAITGVGDYSEFTAAIDAIMQF